MNNLKEHFTNEQIGISYTLVGDYYLPDLALPEENSTILDGSDSCGGII